MLPEFGTKEFNDYIENLTRSVQPVRHKYYDQTVDYASDMAVHVSGAKPEKLIKERRPNESEEVQRYRLDVYKPVTKSDASRVISVMQRVYNPRLWAWNFPEIKSGLVEGDDLQVYLTSGMPRYRSLFNFIKNVYTSRALEDPNMVITVEPDMYTDEMYEPIPFVFNSEQVLDFEDGSFFVLRDDDKIIILDTQYIRKLKVEKDRTFTLEFEIEHGFGIVPAFRVGGIVKETNPPQWFISFIDGVRPHWDKAVTMASDEDGAIVNHVYPEKWEYSVDCDNSECRGGVIDVTINGVKTTKTCQRCGGTGKISTKSPFDIYQISKDAINPDSPLPMPPFGYGEKELDSVRFLDEKIKQEIDKGYAAVNMGILDKVGEDQSGVAKTIDRQDLDAFLQNYANHSFTYVIPNIIYLISSWRYGVFIKDIESIQPQITPPVVFDVLSISQLTDELKGFNESGVNRSFVNGIQIDIIDKRIENDEQKARLKAIVNIDALGGMTNDDILAYGRAITPESRYIHVYAEQIVDALIKENPEFLNMDVVDQRETATEYASKKITVEVVPNEPAG